MIKRLREEKIKAWVISVDMGYGHQRAAYPLREIAYERIITANNDKIISEKDHRLWEESRGFYEAVSRIKEYPIIGGFAFLIYDQMQKISPFFPFKDLSKPNFSVLRLKKLIVEGLCRSLIEYCSKENLPVITTHFVPALAFNYNKYDKGEIYCIITDTDINRVWVADNPRESRIRYFAPCKHVVDRLKQYGVPDNMIIHTGFPLPKENIGENLKIVEKDLLSRLVNLDPQGVFFNKYRELVRERLKLPKNQKFDSRSLMRFKDHDLTLTFAIGGAGAQKEIAMTILSSLKKKILDREIIVNIVVGTKLDLKMFFEQEIKRLGLEQAYGKEINIIFAFDKKTYFEMTNNVLKKTDILWTKPSEMSFYAGLGLPIIIAPPIGAHEKYNMEWLQYMGSGFIQEDPNYCHEWLYYWLNDGRLANAALQGFIQAPIKGTYYIEKYIKNIEHEKNARLINNKS